MFVSKQMVKCYDMVDGNAWAQEILVGTPQEFQNQMVQKQKKLEFIHFRFYTVDCVNTVTGK